MTSWGFIKPVETGEKRVILLPKHVKAVAADTVIVESGFGDSLSIPDAVYKDAGAFICTREEILSTAHIISSIKEPAKNDLKYIKSGSFFVGWMRPKGQGAWFYKKAQELGLTLVDLGVNPPEVLSSDGTVMQSGIKPSFLSDNSVLAGKACVLHASVSRGALPKDEEGVAVLGDGNLSTGAFRMLKQLGLSPKLFNRDNMDSFKSNIHKYGFVVSGIAMDDTTEPLISKELQHKMKPQSILIDGGVDIGNVFEGNRLTNFDEPLYEEDGRLYYAVANTPSVLYREASELLSSKFSEHVYSRSLEYWKDLI